MANVIAGRHFVRGDWTRASLYACRRETVSVLRDAAPAGRGDDLPVPEARLRARARDRGPAARADRAVHARFGRALPAVDVDPDRDPQRAEAREPSATASARTRWARASSCFTSGARSKVVTWEDLVEPEVDADGEPRPAMRAWRGEAAFLSALLTVTSDDPPRICFSPGTASPTSNRWRTAATRTFAEELRRDGDEVRALGPRRRRAPARAAACWSWPSRRRRSRPREIAALRRSSTGAGGCWSMLGPVFAATARAFAHVGLEAFAAALRRAPGRQPGRRSVARQRRRGAVGLGGRAGQLPAAPAHGAFRRAADLLAAHARGRAGDRRRCPGRRRRRWSRPAPKDGARPTCRPSAARRTWRFDPAAIARARSASRSPSSGAARIRDAAGVPRHRAAGHERAPSAASRCATTTPTSSRSAIAWLSDREARVGVGAQAGRPHRARPDRRRGELGVPAVRARAAAADRSSPVR